MSKSVLSITDAGEVIGLVGGRQVHAWLQTSDGLRWEYAGFLKDEEYREGDEFTLEGLRYRSLYGNTRYFWVKVLEGKVCGVYRNERRDGMAYAEFRKKLEEFLGCQGQDAGGLLLLPREEAFSLPTLLGECA